VTHITDGVTLVEQTIGDRSPQFYEAQVGFGDAPIRYAGSAANLQLLWAALLSEQVMGRSTPGGGLRAEKYAICPLCTQTVPDEVLRDDGYRQQ
jgi:hypothetical protein